MEVATELGLEYVKLSIDSNIGILTIDNGKKNLIVNPVLVEIDLLDKWIKQNNLKALIITGNRRYFSDGADVEYMMQQDGEYTAFNEKLNKGKELLEYIEQLPIITVAAINGACFGAGLEIALSCQIRICNQSAFFGLPEVNRGLVPGLCGVQRLTRLIGKSRAIEMCLQGEMLTGEQALNLGIVSKVIKESNCFEAAYEFTKSLIEGKSSMQIAAILECVRTYEDTKPDRGKSAFVEILESMKGMEKDNGKV